MNKRTVQHRPDGKWEVIAPGADRPGAVAATQEAAEGRAREILANSGGGELAIRGLNGQIRQQDLIPTGNDLRSSKG